MQEIKIDSENIPALIFSDLQVHNYKQFNEGDARLRNCLKIIYDVFKMADKHGIEVILFIGDLVDQQRSIPTMVVNGLIQCFKDNFDEYPDIVFVAISGNHDYATKNLIGSPAVTALTSFATIFNRFIILDNDILDIHYGGGSVRLWGIPYYEYTEHFKERLQEVSTGADEIGGINILMQHQTPEGWVDLAADISADDPLYEPFELVLNGHIHEYRVLKQQSPLFISVGNPLPRDLGDLGQPKGVLAVDLSNIDQGHRFIDIGKKYPQFKLKNEGDELTDEDERHYIVWQPVATVEALEMAEDVERFSTNVTNSNLLVNYWEKTEGTDRALLDYGLKLLENLD